MPLYPQGVVSRLLGTSGCGIPPVGVPQGGPPAPVYLRVVPLLPCTSGWSSCSRVPEDHGGYCTPWYAPWWVLYSLVCTMVGIVLPGMHHGGCVYSTRASWWVCVQYPGIMVDIHPGIYTLVYTPGIPWWAYHPPGYMTGYTTPGYTPVFPPTAGVTSSARPATPVCSGDALGSTMGGEPG